MRKHIFPIALLLYFSTIEKTSFCMLPQVQEKNFLSHRKKKHLNTQIKNFLYHIKKKEILSSCLNLKKIEEENYDKFSQADIDWLDDKIIILENVIKTLNINTSNIDIEKKEGSKEKNLVFKINKNNADLEEEQFLFMNFDYENN